MVASWASVMFQVPTFDLGDSLYRRLAEEMKLSGEYFVPTWDGKPFYEKPPTYFGTIRVASQLFDPRDAPVSDCREAGAYFGAHFRASARRLS